MKDIKRIPKLMSLLTQYWMMYPDTRFNQLIHNLQWEYNNKNNSAYREEMYKKIDGEYHTIYEKYWVVNLFYLEDDNFIEFLEDKLKDDNSEL